MPAPETGVVARPLSASWPPARERTPPDLKARRLAGTWTDRRAGRLSKAAVPAASPWGSCRAAWGLSVSASVRAAIAMASTMARTHSPASAESAAAISTARPSRNCRTMRSDAGSWPECAPPPWLARASGLETAAPRRSTLADGATAARWPSPNTQRWPRCTRATTGEKAPVTLDRRLRQPRASNGCCTSNAKASGGGDPGNAPLGLSASAGGVPAGTSRAGPPGAAAATAAAAFSRDTTSAACGASSWESTNKARSSDCQ
mmetsp:Transcript_20598/g.66723  ORF Transcript_20598/g.66723 Transcript_20598/m.66723 type:complete len:261 (-) Transcript_20598:388-1170(-)